MVRKLNGFGGRIVNRNGSGEGSSHLTKEAREKDAVIDLIEHRDFAEAIEDHIL